MKFLTKLLFIVGTVTCLSTLAEAQSTASPAIIGYLTTSGCPSGSTVCFVQYDTVHPLPTSGSGPGGTIDIDQTTPGTTNGVVVNSSALPTGGATAANQTTGNTNTSTISTRIGTTADGCGAGGTVVGCLNSIFTAPSSTVVQPTGTNLHTVVDSGTLTTVSTVTAVTAITNALPAGSNLLGKVSVDQTTPGTTNAIQAIAGTSGGAGRLCTGQIKATATACGTAAAHQVYVYDFSNAANSVTSYFQVFDVAVGSVTLGTTPATASFEIPAGGHLVVPINVGDAFTNQITIGCTTTATGNTSPTNNCSYNVVGK